MVLALRFTQREINWLAVIGTSLTLLGLLVGLYTLGRVRKVARIQANERRLTQELLGVDQVEVDLRRVIAKLSRTHDDADAQQLAQDLSVKLGALQGVRRAMSAQPFAPSNSVGLEDGFFTESFVQSQIDKARSNIDIITGRTLLISGFYTLDKLRQACARGVRVRIVGISADAPDAILEDAMKTVSHPAPRNAADYRDQVRVNQSEIVRSVNEWSADEKEKFFYKAHEGVPRVSMARCDGLISMGFLQFFRDAQPQELKDRQYLCLPVSSPTGQVAMGHFEIAWNESSWVFPAAPSQDPSVAPSVSRPGAPSPESH